MTHRCENITWPFGLHGTKRLSWQLRLCYLWHISGKWVLVSDKKSLRKEGRPDNIAEQSFPGKGKYKFQDLTREDSSKCFEALFRGNLSETKNIGIAWWISQNRRKLEERTFFVCYDTSQSWAHNSSVLQSPIIVLLLHSSIPSSASAFSFSVYSISFPFCCK